MDLNKVMLIGRVTNQPELKTIPSGSVVANLSIATNKTWNDKETKEKKESVEFHNLIAWRKTAEIIGEYVKKGNKIFIEGELQTRNWEKDGVKHYKTEIVVNNLIMLDSPKKEEKKDDLPVVDYGEEVNVDDIPFNS